MTQNKIGRPKVKNPRARNLVVRLTNPEMMRLEAKAKEENISTSKITRTLLAPVIGG